MNDDYNIKMCEEMRAECWDMLKEQLDDIKRIATHGPNWDEEDDKLVKCAFQIIVGEINWRLFNETP